MSSRLIHPRMLETLAPDFFYRRGTIQQATETQSTTGQVKKLWADVPGMTAIQCRISASGGGERRSQNQTYLDATNTALLAGAFTVNEKMRFVDDKGLVYDILLVEPDSEQISTRLTLRLVS
ncbi:MAG: hypothetical protein L0287_06180 [Anaerolineae bacterium]|nr:hypothetical protein [Anaerolineae bacterium]